MKHTNSFKHMKSIIMIISIIISYLYVINDSYASPQEWELTVKPESQNILVGQPAEIQLIWKTSNPILRYPQYVSELPFCVIRKINNGKEKKVILFKTTKIHLEQMEGDTARLAPKEFRGKKGLNTTQSIFLCTKVSNIPEPRKWPPDWDFVFPDSGEYELMFRYPKIEGVNFINSNNSASVGECKIRIVVNNTKASDSDPWELYTPYAAGAYLGEYEGKYGTEGIAALKKILAEYPDSFYAPYAAVGLSKYKTRNNPHAPISEELHSQIESLLLPLSETHMDHPQFPEIAMFLVRSYFWQNDGHNKALQYIQNIADKDPDNPALAHIKDAYKISPSTPKLSPKYKVAKSAEPTDLIFSGLEKIPEGARDVFRQDFENLAGCELSSPTLLLSDEYWGDRGKADMREYHRGWLCRTFNLDQWKIHIDDAKTTDTYTRPRVIRAPQKTWEGEIVVVYFTMELNGLDRRSAEKYDRNIPLNTTALRKENDEWKIISEHTVDPTGRREEAMKKLGLLPETDQAPVPTEEPAPEAVPAVP